MPIFAIRNFRGVRRSLNIALLRRGYRFLWKFPVIILVLTAMNCSLYQWHNYDFLPHNMLGPGFAIYLSSPLLIPNNDTNKHVNGPIIDSIQSFWSFAWYGNVDDSLRSVAHLESDSVRIWASDREDTLYCNIRQDMTGGRWNEWKCGRITYQQLNSRDIMLRMIVYMVFNDGREPRRFEVIWSGKQKTTRIHSDY